MLLRSVSQNQTRALTSSESCLGKNLLYDLEGIIYKEFFVYVENGKISSPVITWTGNGPRVCSFSHTNYHTNALTCAFIIDKQLDIDPYALFRNGELSVMYLLNEDALVATQPVDQMRYHRR